MLFGLPIFEPTWDTTHFVRAVSTSVLCNFLGINIILLKQDKSDSKLSKSEAVPDAHH